MKENNAIRDKSEAYALRVISLYKFLTENREFVMSKQVLRSGTSIGANVCEAQRASSKKDFINKLNIALKEAHETQYWISLLAKSDYIEQRLFKSLDKDNNEIIAILVSIIKTTKQKILHSEF